MPWVGAAIGAGASLLGGVMGGNSAKKAADASAQAQLQAAKIAASAAAFRPVDITSRFGSSQFEMGTDQYGTPILKGASYSASPEMKAIQDRLSAMYGTSLSQAEQVAGQTAPALTGGAQTLFGLGQQYLAKSPEQAAADYYNQQQALMEPGRQREEQRLGQSVFGRGRAGLNISGQGQPELFALSSARAQQDAALAAQAEQAAQQRITFGQGLLGAGAGLYNTMYGLQSAALNPLQTQLGMTQTIEELAQQPLLLGAQLGGQQASAGAQMGQSLLQGGMGAAQAQLQGSLAASSLLGKSLGGIGTAAMDGKFKGMGTDIANWYSGFGGGSNNLFQSNAGVNFLAPGTYG